MNSLIFSDPPNLAVIANKKIFSGETWIAYVSHDEDDGAWQFHGPESNPIESDIVLVSLESVVKLDLGISDLCDLPLGWQAWRDSKETAWQRSRIL